MASPLNDDSQPQEETTQGKTPPSVVINIQSWATPVVGLVMLLVGLLLGYAGRPLLSPPSAPQVALATAAPTQAPPEVVPNDVAPGDTEALMQFLVSQTRHFKGDPNAPVTFIEFSDFK
jgi:hypothetical protein